MVSVREGTGLERLHLAVGGLVDQRADQLLLGADDDSIFRLDA